MHLAELNIAVPKKEMAVPLKSALAPAERKRAYRFEEN